MVPQPGTKDLMQLMFMLAVTLAGCTWMIPPAMPSIAVRRTFRAQPQDQEIVLDGRQKVDREIVTNWVRERPATGKLADIVIHLIPGLGAHQSGFNPAKGAATPVVEIAATILEREGVNFAWQQHRQCVTTAADTSVRGLPQLVRADLHIHSSWSHDSSTPVAAILRAAEARNLDFIAITDHDRNSFYAASQIRQEMMNDGFLCHPPQLIPGQEVSSQEGHILAYFVMGTVPRGMSAAATIRWIHGQGGIAVVAHPHMPGSGTGDPLASTLPINGIEQINGAELYPAAWHNDLSLARLNSDAHYGGSDAHFSSWVGTVVSRIPVTEVSLGAVEAAMRAGLVEAEINSPLVAKWYDFWDSEQLAGRIAALWAWPHYGWQRLQLYLAHAFWATDVIIETRWDRTAEDLYSLWHIPAAIDRIRSAPRSYLWPVPEKLGLRYGSLALAVELGNRAAPEDWPRWPEEVALQIGWEAAF